MAASSSTISLKKDEKDEKEVKTTSPFLPSAFTPYYPPKPLTMNYELLYGKDTLVHSEYVLPPKTTEEKEETSATEKRTRFQDQFQILLNQLKNWGEENKADSSAIAEIESFRHRIFNETITGNQTHPIYFENIKDKLEMIWFELYEKSDHLSHATLEEKESLTESLENGIEQYNHLFSELGKACAPGIETHVREAYQFLTNSISLWGWNATLRSFIVKEYVPIYCHLFRKETGKRIAPIMWTHVETGLLKYAVSQGFAPLDEENIANVDDPYLHEVGLDERYLEDFHRLEVFKKSFLFTYKNTLLNNVQNKFDEIYKQRFPKAIANEGWIDSNGIDQLNKLLQLVEINDKDKLLSSFFVETDDASDKIRYRADWFNAAFLYYCYNKNKLFNKALYEKIPLEEKGYLYCFDKQYKNAWIEMEDYVACLPLTRLNPKQLSLVLNKIPFHLLMDVNHIPKKSFSGIKTDELWNEVIKELTEEIKKIILRCYVYGNDILDEIIEKTEFLISFFPFLNEKQKTTLYTRIVDQQLAGLAYLLLPYLGQDTKLFKMAIEKGNQKIIEMILDQQKEIDINHRIDDHEESTPLMIAIRNGHEKIIELLLKKGCHVNNGMGNKGEIGLPLTIALKQNNLKIARYLIAHGAYLPKEVPAFYGMIFKKGERSKVYNLIIQLNNQKKKNLADPSIKKYIETGVMKTYESAALSQEALEKINKPNIEEAILKGFIGLKEVCDLTVSQLKIVKIGIAALHLIPESKEESLLEGNIQGFLTHVKKRLTSFLNQGEKLEGLQNDLLSSFRVLLRDESLSEKSPDEIKENKHWKKVEEVIERAIECNIPYLVSFGIRYLDFKAEEIFSKAVRQLKGNVVRFMISHYPHLKIEDEKTSPQPLLIAAIKDNVVEVKSLLRTHCDVNETNALGQTALMIASGYNHMEVTHALAEHKTCDVNYISHEGWTALLYALRNNNLKIARFLIAKGAEIPFESPALNGSLFTLMEQNKITSLLNQLSDQKKKNLSDSLIQKYIASGFFTRQEAAALTPEEFDRLRRSSMRAMVFQQLITPKEICRLTAGNVELINVSMAALHLLPLESTSLEDNIFGRLDQIKKRVISFVHSKKTPKNDHDQLLFHFHKVLTDDLFALNTQSEIIANPYCKKIRECIEKAAESKDSEIVLVGTQYFNLNVNTLFLKAIKQGKMSTLQAMLDQPNEIDLNAKIEGLTPLMMAAKKQDIHLMRFLLEKKADINATDDEKQTVLMQAINEGHLDVIRVLAQNKECHVNAVDKEQWTPLMFAVSMGSIEVVQLLLERTDCNVNAVDKDGWTALTQALRWNNIKMARLLIERGANVTLEPPLAKDMSFTKEERDKIMDLLKQLQPSLVKKPAAAGFFAGSPIPKKVNPSCSSKSILHN